MQRNTDVEYKIVFTENAEIEIEHQDGSRETVERDSWTLVELYKGGTHAVWYFNTKEDAEELKRMKEELLL